LFIPELFPGIIQVYDRGSATDNPQRLLALLGKLKSCIPAWKDISIGNSIIKVEGERFGHDRVRIGHIQDGVFAVDAEFAFGRDGDATPVLNALTQNAAKGQLPRTSPTS
jgi:hypothetical protein